MKKSDLAGASASMDEKTLKQTPITNVDQAFQGKISGVNAVRTSGQPGSAVAVSVRGIATINANSEPLYVVDGVIFNSRATVVHHSVWVTSSVMVLTLQYLHCL